MKHKFKIIRYHKNHHYHNQSVLKILNFVFLTRIDYDNDNFYEIE